MIKCMLSKREGTLVGMTSCLFNSMMRWVLGSSQMVKEPPLLYLSSIHSASTNNFLLSIFLSADHRTWLERSNQARGVLGWGCYQEESESSNVFMGSYLIRYSLSKRWLRRRAAINPYSRCGKDRPLVGVSSCKSMMNVSIIDGLSSCPELI